ncbi:MAG: NfeD family protein [Candidatus Cloacimonetes bacterium]|nr:NfeD family protein [Candidatus Cloacimonadota bacterium]
MEAWMIWVGIGIICMIIEIFTPGFLFMSFGVGAILTGIIESIFTLPISFQILIFIVITFIVFISTRKLSKKIISASSEETNIYALKGKSATVVKDIPEDGRGYVKVGGEEWSAVSEDGKKIGKDKKVTIQNVEGNKLIVTIKKDEEEETA